MQKYPIITICCSTKYIDEIIKYYNELTEQGFIVLADLTDHSRQELFDKAMVDDMHKQKIDMADEVHVLIKNNHYGESVKSELLYAIDLDKYCKIIHI